MSERITFDRRRGREIDDLAEHKAKFIRQIPRIRLHHTIIMGYTQDNLPIVLYLFFNLDAAEKVLSICNDTPVSPSSHYELGPELNEGDDYYSVLSGSVIKHGPGGDKLH